jgi:ApaG protein
MPISTLTTSGVEIKVEPEFRKDLSQIENRSYVFNYSVYIKNTNPFDVQLVQRDWYIFDSLNEIRLVNGEGVIGLQPILKPGESFTYTSGCDLNSEIGFMKGFYTFRRLDDNENFRVTVPHFNLEYPAKMN